MQEVEVYLDIFEAKSDMNQRLRKGWRVHTCSIGSYMAGYTSRDHILVVYERNK